MSKNKNTTEKTSKKDLPTEVKELSKKQKKEDKKTLAVARMFLYMAEFIIVIGVLVAAGFFWSQPQLLSQKINQFLDSGKTVAIDENDVKLQNSVDNLMVQVNRLTEQNGYFMNLKADSSVVLGIVERMDLMEKRILKLSTLSNDGALILSAAMMVKEAAAIGQSFQYEAEILKQLSQNRIEIDNEVNAIYALSSTNLPSDKAMVDKFNIAYEAIIEEMKPVEHDLHWKEKVIKKLKQYVKVQRTDEPEPVKGYDKLVALKMIKDLVDNQDFVGATGELSKAEHSSILENVHIQNWVSEVKTKLKFYQDLSKISAYSLILMKTENMKNTPEVNTENLESKETTEPVKTMAE